MSADENRKADRHPAKDAHRTLGLWSIRRALTLAFSGAAVLLVAAWAFVSWLLGSPPRSEAKPLDTTAQLELLKLVFALVAGAGALVALVTAYRRQRIDERAQAHAEHDAAEQRVTLLYGQAVEQLGHDRAAVRLGGLYSLERLAQDHRQHRQTVIDVVCAYLRMPFQPPAGSEHSNDSATDSSPPPSSGHEDPGQELQVRLTAQRLLHRHLTAPAGESPPATFWDDIIIDLTGAYLIDFDFTNCWTRQATFANTYFSGETRFDLAGFGGDARFDEARFAGDSWFSSVQFDGEALFKETHFSGLIWLNNTLFSEWAVFEGAQFSGEDNFFAFAQFNRLVTFRKARFNGMPSFAKAQFNGLADFWQARFNGMPSFAGAQFSEDSFFGEAQFHGLAIFDEARFCGNTRFVEAQFNRAPSFERVQFSGATTFDRAHFSEEPNFEGAMAKTNIKHVWPSPWQAQTQSPEADMAQLTRAP